MIDLHLWFHLSLILFNYSFFVSYIFICTFICSSIHLFFPLFFYSRSHFKIDLNIDCFVIQFFGKNILSSICSSHFLICCLLLHFHQPSVCTTWWETAWPAIEERFRVPVPRPSRSCHSCYMWKLWSSRTKCKGIHCHYHKV